MTPSERIRNRLLRGIGERPGLSAAELAEALRIPRNTVYHALRIERRSVAIQLDWSRPRHPVRRYFTPGRHVAQGTTT